MTPSRGSCWAHPWSEKSVEKQLEFVQHVRVCTVVPAEQAQGKLKIGVNR